jgi:hypothetical protein
MLYSKEMAITCWN